MSIEDYEKELKEHDWYHAYSDDPRVWEMGRFDYNRLVKLSKLSNEHEELFKKYKEQKLASC